MDDNENSETKSSSFINKPTAKIKYSFLVYMVVLSILLSLLGTGFVVIASILPNSPYEIEEDPIVDQIWDDLGPIQRYLFISGEGTIILSIVETDNEIQYFDSQSNSELDISIHDVTIIASNGAVNYLDRSSSLLINYNNNTLIDISSSFGSIWFDAESGKIKLYYKQGEKNLINRNIGSSSENLGEYFIFKN